MKRILLTILITLFASVSVADTTEIKPQQKIFSWLQRTSQGVLTGSHDILRGLPNKSYKKGDRIHCMAYKSTTITDNAGKKYDVYVYVRELTRKELYPCSYPPNR